MCSKQARGDPYWALAHQTTEKNIDDHEWKSGEMLGARTWRPVGGQPASSFTQHTDKFVIDDDDMDSDTITESDLQLILSCGECGSTLSIKVISRLRLCKRS